MLAVIVFTAPGVKSASQAERELLPPLPDIEHLSFGFQPVVADLLWIRALQDIAYCEEKLENNNCTGNGWLSQVLFSILELDPSFNNAAYIGGLALNVLVSDMQGASKFYNKAVELFPSDKHILVGAGFHAFTEEKDSVKAAKLFIRAGDLGFNEWIYSLASRLLTDAGAKDVHRMMYDSIREKVKDKELLQNMQKRLGLSDAEVRDSEVQR